MADRVAVFNQGRIEQVGTPEEVYDRPRHRLRRRLRRRRQHRRAGEVAARLDRPRARPSRCGRSASGLERPATARSAADEVACSRRRYHGPATRLEVALDAGPLSLDGRARQRRDRRASAGCRRAAHAASPGAGDAMRPLAEPAVTRARATATACAPRSRPGSGAAAALSRCSCSLPPLLWLGVVYLGSLLALLVQSFFPRRLHRPGRLRAHARTYAELLTQPRQPRHHPAHGRRWRPRSRWPAPDRLPDRLLRRPLRARPRQGAVLPRRDAAAVVELSGPGLRLEADPGQGGHRQLGGRADRHHLAARRRPGAAGDRRPVALGLLPRHVPGLHLHLAALHDPAGAGGARARPGLADRGLGRPRRPAAARPSARSSCRWPSPAWSPARSSPSR